MPSQCRVALDVPLAQTFDYACDEATRQDIGRRAVVPFGSQNVAPGAHP